jgi:hypothetical protein
MKTVGVQRRVASWVIAAVLLLLPISPVLAGAPKHRKPAEVTFTKWITTSVAPLLLAGVAGGDVAGEFAGEVLQVQASTNPDLTPILRLEAIYEVHAFDPRYSFSALIRGGQTAVGGAGLLDGVILSGWRTGSQVHVEFQTLSSCAGNPAGPCFEGTIRIDGDPDE